MKVGVVGTGLMGAPMALRLLSAGHQVWVYNRTQARLKPLELAGAISCLTVEALVAQVDVLILMVTNGAAIRTLLLPDRAAPSAVEGVATLANRTVIQMGTIAPLESRALQQEFSQRGANYLEAPVLGSIPEAKNGKLIVMVGAEPDSYRQWSPLLHCFGDRVYHAGPVGAGAALKLAMNQLIGSLTAAFAQSLGLMQQEGIDTDLFMDVLRQSAVYAPTFDKKLKRMKTRNFADPNFPAKHLLKDMTLFVEAARAAGLEPLPAESVQKIVERVVRSGLADDDYSALFNIISPLLENGEG